MKLRSILRDGQTSVAAQHEQSGAWVDIDGAAETFEPTLRGPFTRDLMALLSSRAKGQDSAVRLMERAVDEQVAIVEPELQLPFRPTSLRCFLGWEQHWVQGARSLVRHHMPAAMPFITGFEAITRRPFPALRPGSEYSRHPVYYTGNPLTIVADGEVVPWPSYSKRLDYELEFGVVVDRPIRDASEAVASHAIGGFVIFNDFSARDIQWDEERRGNFGPVVKTKTFGSSMGAVVVTADEVWSRLDDLAASVVVDGETWSTTSTAGLRYGPAACLAYASRGEDIWPGELLTSGTLPNGSGLELDRWIQPGSTVTLSIDVIGSVSNVVGVGVGANVSASASAS